MESTDRNDLVFTFPDGGKARDFARFAEGRRGGSTHCGDRVTLHNRRAFSGAEREEIEHAWRCGSYGYYRR